MPDTTPAVATIRVVRVRHCAGRWLWVCLLCGEWSRDLTSPPPGVAADAGRAHYLVWHTNEPVTR